jgi:hypothetical protein
MMFVYPLFLWALAAISVPIIIHLFNFRRYKKVYFTNVKFLKELKQESKSKSRLKALLILLTRCLAIICLVLAFSQPLIQNKKALQVNTGANAVSIYIDNSFSMQNINKQGPLLDVCKTRAKELVKAFGNTGKFQIITNDFEGKHQRFQTIEDALSVVDEIKVSSAVRQLGDVIKRQSEFLNSSNLNNKKIYLFSDAQKSTFNLASVRLDTIIKTTIIPLTANQVNNVYIDSCWFETPLQQKGFIQKLHAVIVNNGNSAIEAGSAKLFLNKQQIAISSFSLEANSKNEIQFTFECKQEGFNYGSIKIEDYPITFDDELFFAFNSTVNISACIINGKDQPENNAFGALFKSDSLFSFTLFSEQAINYNVFKTSQVIILNQVSDLSSGLMSELLKFTNQGGALVIIPPKKVNLTTYNTALSMLHLPNIGPLDSNVLKVDRIEMASKFYSGVFEKIEDRINLPIVNRHYNLVKSSRLDFESILTLQNGESFMGLTKLNNSFVYLFSSPLIESFTNFNKHALFVPTFYQLSFNSIKASPIFYVVSNNVVINIKNEVTTAEIPPHIKKLSGNFDIIPEVRLINNSLYLYTHHQLSDQGFYEVNRNNVTLLPLAFNFSRKESDLTCYTVEELTKLIGEKNLKNVSLIEDAQSNITNQILREAGGTKLWKLFIILTLLFVTTEVALLRLLK